MRLLLSGLLLLPCVAPAPASADGLSAPDLIKEAYLVAGRATDPQTRALCMAEIALAWHEAGMQPLAADALEEAVLCAAAAPGVMAQALSLRSIALRAYRLDPARGRHLLQDAIRSARDLKFAAEKAVALREVAFAAARLQLQDAPELIQEALAAARKVDSAVFRSACLRDVAVGLQPLDALLSAQTFIESRDALQAAPLNDAGLPLARAELAGAWAPFDLSAARAVADDVTDEALHSLCIRMIAEAVAPKNPDTALAVAQELPAGIHRARAIAAAAAALPADAAIAAAALASSALADLGDITGEEADEARADIAAALAWSAPEEAVSLVAAIQDPDLHNETLCTVAERVGQADPRAGLALLGEVDDPVATEPVIVTLAVALAPQAPEEALARVRSVLGRRLKVDGLLAIARLALKQSKP